ncbi:hypothetical protein COOONC_01913 [Cooperia oncophora]
MVHIIDMYTVRMPIELRAVRDKDLLCHIINNIRSLQKQVSKLKAEKKQVENERDELKCMVDDLKEFRLKADQRLSELEQRAKDAEKRAADETLRREEFEQDLQVLVSLAAELLLLISAMEPSEGPVLDQLGLKYDFSSIRSIHIRQMRNFPPIFSHEFVIQNHGDIMSCVLMVFIVGLMFPLSASMCSVFVAPQYNETVNITSELGLF